MTSTIIIATATVMLALTGVGCLLAGIVPLVIGARRDGRGDHDLVLGLGVIFVLMDLLAALVGGAVLLVGRF
ncbi:hypothetical protein HZF05_16340 [Sphingomonas sp. CGMCC 1.13654]|uniref:Uncharacterized protein n=1 Tax=Sphingomonas chungangi TaxID=2683589 RepID=A0A838L8Y4_9SPHN|nr:hypothetical protein [Sphingomonas chungangi]MBA2935654.1 hypothetical protein [Sphingomonas chungangi]MVW54345.1 hypothetical protein [Sphingomonas chungangi]